MKTSFYDFVDDLKAFDTETSQLIAVNVCIGIIVILYFFGFRIA